MANLIRLRRSAVAGKAPATADLALGELAVNTTDGKLYLKKSDGGEVIVEVGAVTTVAGRTGQVTLTKSDVGLSSVDNTSDTAKPVSAAAQVALNGKASSVHSHVIADVSGLQTSLDVKAPLASPALTGTPTAPTQAQGNNSTRLATTAYVDTLGATKANATHVHAVADVSGLQAALDAKQAAGSYARTDSQNAFSLQQTFNGGIARAPLIAKSTDISYGGALLFEKHGNSILNGNLLVEMAFDQIRFLENASPWRGAYLSIANMAGNAASRILTTSDSIVGCYLLGSVATNNTSPSFTLSGLDLSSYKFVLAVVKNVDPTSSTVNSASVSIGGVVLYSAMVAKSIFAIIELSSGYLFTHTGAEGASSISNLSTSITITTSAGNFAGNGTVAYYGVK